LGSYGVNRKEGVGLGKPSFLKGSSWKSGLSPSLVQ
jgi:hypothetical protein